jgi:Tol biopolymer transport system component
VKTWRGRNSPDLEFRLFFLAVLGIFLALLGCQGSPKEMRRPHLMRDLINLDQKSGWRILVHGMDELSYFSPSDGKLVVIYSRFSDPKQSWIGFGSMLPDGKKLALATESSGQPSATLTIVDIQSHKQHIVLSRPYLFGPRWSPDGKRIAFTCRSQSSGNFDLDVYEEGTASVSLVVTGELPSGEGNFDWSPDGKKIVYQSESREVRIVNVQSKEKQAVAKGGYPTWSPDGKLICYHGNGEDAYILQNLETGQSRSILVGENAGSPTWSPDARYIAYTRPYGGIAKKIQDASLLTDTHGDLWVMDTESHLAEKVFTAGESIYPTYWGPIAR